VISHDTGLSFAALFPHLQAHTDYACDGPYHEQ
jgi:hypothetical protein